MTSKIKNNGSGKDSLDREIAEKFVRLAVGKFNQRVCYEFFGNLNQAEISRLMEILSTDASINSAAGTKELMTSYLKKLEAAVMAKQKKS